jgi:hypothetical protein
MFPRAQIQKHAGSLPKIIYLPIPNPIITTINTLYPFVGTTPGPIGPACSVEKLLSMKSGSYHLVG